MTKSKIFFYFCSSFIVGVFGGSFFNIPELLLLGFLILGVGLVSVWWRKERRVVVAGFCFIIIAAGIISVHPAGDYPQGGNNTLINQNVNNGSYGKEVILKGVVSQEPDIRISSARLKTLLLKSDFNSGAALVTTGRYPEYKYGDALEIKGRLQEPKTFPDFDYKGYLAKEGIGAVIYYPKIKLIGHDAPCSQIGTDQAPTSLLLQRGEQISQIYNTESIINNINSKSIIQNLKSNIQCHKYKLYKTLLNIKSELRKSLEKLISPPQGAILNAMILGDKQKISDELKDKLSITGTRHITAISGMHIAIIGEILLFILIGVGFWRRQALFISIASLALFIIMIGAPASAVRAGIMGGLLIFAQGAGRASSASRTVVFAAAVMLALNPLLLKYDAGFQLSFAAVLGIIYLKPILDKWLTMWQISHILGRILPDSKKAFLSRNHAELYAESRGNGKSRFKDILTMTLSAQIGVLPILIYNFGQFSTVSPLVNVLIVPLLPLIIAGGFLLGFAGMIWQSLSQIFSWPLWLMLTYVVKVIDWFSALPLSTMSAGRGSWVLVAGYYILLIWLVRRWRRNRLT